MNHKRDMILGLVFFAGLGLILVATAVLKDWTTLEKPFEYQVYFSSAEGLRAGDPVTVYGMRAGRVGKVEINKSQDRRDKRIVVTLEVKEEIPFREGIPYTIAIEDSSFLGGKVVTVDPEAREGGRPYHHDEPLMGVSYSNPLKQVASVFAQGKEDIKGILSGLASVVRKMDNNQSTIGALFNERGLYDSIMDSAQRINKIIRNAQAGKGTIGALLTDRQPFDDLKATLAQARKITKEINEGKGLLARLIHDQRLGENVSAAVQDIREVADKVRAGEGTLGKLLVKDQVYNDLAAAIRDAKDLLAQAKSGKGVVGRLVGDPVLGEKVAELITDARDIVREIKEGKGTLGKLVNDDTVYTKLNLVFTQISRSLEDYREAAPVSTFIQVLGSSFR